jgi:hypothetical protein
LTFDFKPYNSNMAPVRKRTSLRAKVASSQKSTASVSQPTLPASSDFNDRAWRLTKKDKRTLKHTALMDRVREAGVTKRKRRRPVKNLKVEELKDALPAVDEDEWEGFEDDEGSMKRRRRRGEGKMVMHSLKHRPGAMKRKEVLQKREIERFGRNLAQLGAGGGGAATDEPGNAAMKGGEGAQGSKWAALRAFITTTMEQDPAFRAK